MNIQAFVRLSLPLMALTLTACGLGSDLEFEVESYVTGTNLAGEEVGRLEITSKNDGAITIDEVILNRGNCETHDPIEKKLPKKLKFGESVKLVIIPDRCKLQEVEIVTRDSGSVTYEMDYE